MAKGQKTGGRTKGTPNKATASMRAAWLDAFDALGGVDGLTAWAVRNPDRFYTLSARLIPPAKPEVTVGGVAPDRVEIVFTPPPRDFVQRLQGMSDEELEALARTYGLDV